MINEKLTAEEEEAADLGLPPRGFRRILVSTPVKEGSKDPEISSLSI